MTITASEHRLDERLARAAVSWSMDPVSAFEDAADRLVALAAGNRTAVHRALSRVDGPRLRRTATSDRAAAILRLAIARGQWAW